MLTKERDLFAQVITELRPGATFSEHIHSSGSHLVCTWTADNGDLTRLAFESWAVRNVNHSQLTRLVRNELASMDQATTGQNA